MIDPTSSESAKARLLVARAVRICNAANVMDFNGHVSMRDERDPNVIWINNRHASRSTLTADDIVPYDITAGARIGEGIEPPSEHHIHREVYLRLSEVKGIVHSHPENVLTLSAARITVKPSTSVGSFLPEAGAPTFDSPVLINTQARGSAMAQALGDAPAIVLRQHGTVTVGRDVYEAVVRMICIEDNARLQIRAIGLGGVHYLHGGELAGLAVENWTNAVDKYWHYHEETARRSGAFEGLE
jgi:ribulose-5-phosphate 4-epimerase/fuculose-1-phosphate aldolase